MRKVIVNVHQYNKSKLPHKPIVDKRCISLETEPAEGFKETILHVQYRRASFLDYCFFYYISMIFFMNTKII